MTLISKTSLGLVFLFLSLALYHCGGDSTTVTGPGPVGPGGGGNDVAVEEPFSFNIAVAGQNRFRLEGINGNIEISGSTSANTVVIRGERRVESNSEEDARAGLEQLRVTVTEGGDVILVRTIQPQQDDDRNYIVNYRVTLPRNLAVIVNAVNGNIDVGSINARVTVTSVNGVVDLSQIVGSTLVTMVNGTIDARITLPTDGTIEFDLVNGEIDLDIPRSTSARFVATVTNGSITITNLDLRTSVNTPNRVEGTLGGGDGRIMLGTLNGSIDVRGF